MAYAICLPMGINKEMKKYIFHILQSLSNCLHFIVRYFHYSILIYYYFNCFVC